MALSAEHSIMLLLGASGPSCMPASPNSSGFARPPTATARLAAAAAEHGGIVLAQDSYGFCAAFLDVGGIWRAVAAVDPQQADEVRLALHAAGGRPRSAADFDPLIARGRAILDAAHTGQILLSAQAAATLAPTIPQTSRLRDLGLRRLNDLLEREHLYDLLIAGRSEQFSPPLTLDALPNNLSPQIHALIGRLLEMTALHRLLQQRATRLLMLSGPAGTGKTRLAFQIAAGLVPCFAHGVYSVSLANIEDADLLPAAIGQALGIKEEPGPDALAGLAAYLHNKQLLLLLDNCEQVIGASQTVAALLEAAPGLKVLATGRAPLGLPTEIEFSVPTLPLPDLQHLPSLGDLARSEAVALFIARAKEADPAFALTAENATVVAAICRRLDGLPLALELAAARVRQMSLAAMLTRMASPDAGSLPLLAGGASYLPDRQHTLRAAIGWSYRLLEPDEQQLFTHLGVFVGGCTAHAATAVVEDMQQPRVADEDLMSSKLAGLVSKSLLRSRPTQEGPPRYEMLSMIREYALEQLAGDEAGSTLRRRYADYYLNLAEQAEMEQRGPHQVAWLERLAAEQDNLRAALSWALAQGDTAFVFRLGAALWRYWRVRGQLSEGRRLLAALPSTDPPLPSMALARAYEGASALAWELGDYTQATLLGERSLELWQVVGDPAGLAAALRNMAIVAAGLHDYGRAIACNEESLSLYRSVGDQAGIGRVHNNLGDLARGQNELTRARHHYEQALLIGQALQDKSLLSWVLYNLGQVLLGLGETRQAGQRFGESMDLFIELANDMGLAYSLVGLAGVAGKSNEAERAARLLGAADRLIASSGAQWWPIDRQAYEKIGNSIRQELSEADYQTAYAAGTALDHDAALDYARVPPYFPQSANSASALRQ